MSRSVSSARRFPTGLALSLLWATLMGLYIYNDYFSLYLPRTLEKMAAGQLAFGPATPTALLIVSIMLAVPAMMIFLSAALPRLISRWLNIVLGVVYTVIEGLTFIGTPLFYQVVVGIEIVTTLLVVFHAIRWPRDD
jgi:hypothetical protein